MDFLYDVMGNEIAQVSSTETWMRGEMYAAGRHWASLNNSTTYFNHADWLGTERARSTSTGALYETCTSLPFGDWLTCAGSDPSPMHFTGKEHDSESGLDNFSARYDSSQYGRFMTPDSSSYSKPINPQTWNLYAYALDNPIVYVDLTGHNVSLQQCFYNKGACLEVLVHAAQLPNGVTAVVNSKGLLELKGDLSKIKGGNALRLLQLVNSSKTAFFWIGTEAPRVSGGIGPVGGGTSGLTSQGFSLNFSVVEPDPSKVDSGDLSTGAYLKSDGTVDHNGPIPGANQEETAAHEFLGHVWADLIGGQIAGTEGNRREALIAEDRVRNTDPTRGLKIYHQREGVDLIRPVDVPRITNPGDKP